MKARVVAVLAACVFGATAMADVLNWQISGESETFDFQKVVVHYAADDNTASSGSPRLEFEGSGATGDSDSTYYYDFGGTRSSKTLVDTAYTFQNYLPAGYTSASALNFYVEFLNSSNQVTGWENFTVSSADFHNYISSSWNDVVVTPVSARAAPEPTSGLLLLMGGALLALRRKRA